MMIEISSPKLPKVSFNALPPHVYHFVAKCSSTLWGQSERDSRYDIIHFLKTQMINLTLLLLQLNLYSCAFVKFSLML